jgi:hypothetical protein
VGSEVPQRYYTVDEANASLAELRSSLERIREARRSLIRSARRVRDRASADGEAAEHWEALRVLRQEIEGLAARSVVLRDAEQGLIDFPARREGRLVYLCWQPDDEDRVGYWHEAGAGFSNRKPL